LLAELEPGPAFEVGQTLYATDPKREGTLLCNGPSEESGFKKSGRNSPGALKQEDLRIPDDAEVTLKGLSEDRMWGEIWLAEGGGQTGWIPLRNLSSRRRNRAAAVSSQPEPEPEPGKARVTLQNVATVKQRTGHVVAELQVRTNHLARPQGPAVAGGRAPPLLTALTPRCVCAAAAFPTLWRSRRPTRYRIRDGSFAGPRPAHALTHSLTRRRLRTEPPEDYPGDV